VTVGMVFRLPLRKSEGFLRSFFALLGSDCRVPDHTTISRRARKLGKLPIGSAAGNKPVHILVDSTGLKIHVGDLRKPPKNRDSYVATVSTPKFTSIAQRLQTPAWPVLSSGATAPPPTPIRADTCAEHLMPNSPLALAGPVTGNAPSGGTVSGWKPVSVSSVPANRKS
jgi:hypothetical protein